MTTKCISLYLSSGRNKNARIEQSIKSSATQNYLETAWPMAPKKRATTELITQLTRNAMIREKNTERTKKKIVTLCSDNEWEKTTEIFGGIHIKWVRRKPTTKKIVRFFARCRPKNNNSSAYTLTMPRFMFVIFFFVVYSLYSDCYLFSNFNTFPLYAHSGTVARLVMLSSAIHMEKGTQAH